MLIFNQLWICWLAFYFPLQLAAAAVACYEDLHQLNVLNDTSIDLGYNDLDLEAKLTSSATPLNGHLQALVDPALHSEEVIMLSDDERAQKIIMESHLLYQPSQQELAAAAAASMAANKCWISELPKNYWKNGFLVFWRNIWTILIRRSYVLLIASLYHELVAAIVSAMAAKFEHLLNLISLKWLFFYHIRWYFWLKITIGKIGSYFLGFKALF